MKSDLVETLVGGAVIVAALLFFNFAQRTSSNGAGSGGYHVSAQFDNAAGVNVGTDVRIAGIKVGSVVGQSLDPKSYQAKVDMILDPSVQLADDTSAKISSEGLLGASFVALDPGGSDEKLKEGSVISYTQGAVDLWSLISQTMFNNNKSSKPADGTTQPQQ